MEDKKPVKSPEDTLRSVVQLHLGLAMLMTMAVKGDKDAMDEAFGMAADQIIKEVREYDKKQIESLNAELSKKGEEA